MEQVVESDRSCCTKVGFSVDKSNFLKSRISLRRLGKLKQIDNRFAVYGRNSVRKLFARHIQPFCSLRATSGHFEFCAPHKASSSGLVALIGTSPFPRRPHQNPFTFTTSHALLHRMRNNRIQQNLQYLTHIGWNSFLRAPFYPVNLTV